MAHSLSMYQWCTIWGPCIMPKPTSYKCTEAAELLPLAMRFTEGRALDPVPGRAEWYCRLMLDAVPFPAIKVIFGADGRWLEQDGTNRVAGSIVAGFSHIPAIENPSPFGFARRRVR
jgi:hypothetical protein